MYVWHNELYAPLGAYIYRGGTYNSSWSHFSNFRSALLQNALLPSNFWQIRGECRFSFRNFGNRVRVRMARRKLTNFREKLGRKLGTGFGRLFWTNFPQNVQICLTGPETGPNLFLTSWKWTVGALRRAGRNPNPIPIHNPNFPQSWHSEWIIWTSAPGCIIWPPRGHVVHCCHAHISAHTCTYIHVYMNKIYACIIITCGTYITYVHTQTIVFHLIDCRTGDSEIRKTGKVQGNRHHKQKIQIAKCILHR